MKNVTDLQALLDGLEEGDLKELAQKVEKLWAIRKPADMASVTDTMAAKWTTQTASPTSSCLSGARRQRRSRGTVGTPVATVVGVASGR